MKAEATFEVKDWQEEDRTVIGEGAKTTRASWTQTYSGEVEGDESVECLMYYRPDGTTYYLAITCFSGRLGERTGGFVTRSTGEFGDGLARATSEVLAGSGTGGLTGLRGTGTGEVGHDMKGTFCLDYDLD
jgi:hypothetical protein